MGSTFLTGIAIILTDILIEEALHENVLIKVIGVIIAACVAFYIPVVFKFFNMVLYSYSLMVKVEQLF